jgi:arginyl-tRNA synthetase
MLPRIQADLRRRFAEGAAELFGITLEEPVIEVPRDLAHADLASPLAFELAKRIKAATGEKRPPRAIAEALAAWIGDPVRAVPGVARVEVAGAGYINLFLDRAAVLTALSAPAPPPLAGQGKVIVEHTSVNPNKSAHVGHLRNSVLGDSVVRLLRAAGQTVEVQNYIDNTGVQVADVVVGFLHVEPHSLEEVRAIPEPFDRYCNDLYTRVGLFYRDGRIDGPENPGRLALRAEVQHAVETGEGEIAEMAEVVATRNLEAHLRTMLRLGIQYDALPRESEILHSNFWAEAFEMLKAAGAIQYVEEGRHAGCWVMRAEEGAGAAEDDQYSADKILVKSNGIITYAGKDIAYHLWKLNRIDRDFNYRRFFTYPDGHVAWISTPGPDEEGHPRFGHGARYVNVIDVGQSYVQDFVKRAVMEVIPGDPRVAASTHLDYEKVGLTVATCDELGLELTAEERTRSFIPMSGRKGRVVISDDLIDRLEERALEEVRKRQRGYPETEERDIAHKIAVGALRYFLMKFTRNSVIAFDFREALSFEGETGPYIQNAAVRINSIFTKAAGRGIAADSALDSVEPDRVAAVLAAPENAEFWPIVYTAAQLPEVVDRAVAALEPAVVAKYAFELAQAFNKFYQKPENRIVEETDDARRAVMIEMSRAVRATLVRALEALGIETPVRM